MFRQAAPPRKRNRFAHAVEELGSRILRGDLKPGEIMPNEAELGRKLGASRTVVREAVKSLAAKGLLEPRTRTGTRVLESIHWNLLDLDILAGSHNDLLLQMGGLISVGLRAGFRISTRSNDAGLPLHGRVFDAIRDRHPEQARETMAQLLSSTREFLERELAGSVHDGAKEPRKAAR